MQYTGFILCPIEMLREGDLISFYFSEKRKDCTGRVINVDDEVELEIEGEVYSLDGYEIQYDFDEPSLVKMAGGIERTREEIIVLLTLTGWATERSADLALKFLKPE